mgnify:CR=1 FL=1
MMEQILTAIIFLPLFSAVVLGLIRADIKLLRVGAMFSSVVTLLLVLLLVSGIAPSLFIPTFEPQLSANLDAILLSIGTIK